MPVQKSRTAVGTAIALLLVSEILLYLTYVVRVGRVELVRLAPLVVVAILGAALYAGESWARWVLLLPVGFRLWNVVPVAAAAWGVGQTGTGILLGLIALAELLAALILLRLSRQRTSPV